MDTATRSTAEKPTITNDEAAPFMQGNNQTEEVAPIADEKARDGMTDT